MNDYIHITDFQVELSEIVSNSPQIFSCAFNQLLATAYSSASQLTNVLLPQLFSVARGDEDRKQIIESILDAVTVSTDNSRMAQESLAVLKTISKRMRGELLPFKEMINASLQSNGASVFLM